MNRYNDMTFCCLTRALKDLPIPNQMVSIISWACHLSSQNPKILYLLNTDISFFHVTFPSEPGSTEVLGHLHFPYTDFDCGASSQPLWILQQKLCNAFMSWHMRGMFLKKKRTIMNNTPHILSLTCLGRSNGESRSETVHTFRSFRCLPTHLVQAGDNQPVECKDEPLKTI